MRVRFLLKLFLSFQAASSYAAWKGSDFVFFLLGGGVVQYFFPYLIFDGAGKYKRGLGSTSSSTKQKIL